MKANCPSLSTKPIPVSAGIGLRFPHYQDIAFTGLNSDIAWLEVHSENFFAQGGMSHVILELVASKYPISFHGVGLSLGSADPLDKHHLHHLKILIDRYQPGLVSEHISWSKVGDIVLNDLLPLPYTEEALNIVVEHISEVQDILQRQILVENPSSYLEFNISQMPEYEFMKEVAVRSGCGILLDINNIYVTHKNHGVNMHDYLAHIPKASVQEIHLAGHTTKIIEDETLWIDHHGDHVCPDVWALYTEALQKFGSVPTLIEWDTDVPSLETLINEAKKAQHILEQTRIACAA